jgi:hypothetical protein
MSVEPGVDEERELDLGRGRRDEQGSCPDAFGGTAGARESGRELARLM